MAPVDVGAGATPSDNTGGAGGVGEMIEPPASGAFTCPADPGTPNFSAQVQEVAGVPPMGNFGQGFSIIEGAVWTGDALYFSHIATDSQPNPARILSLAADGAVSTFLESSFSNGIALDANGDLIIARHSDGSITRISLPDGAETVIVGDYQGEGFNSPNDIAVRSDGNLYFTDPAYQKPDSRQEVPTRIYHVTAAGDISVVDGDKQAPNGITLSLDENWLYVGGQMPLTRYPVMADGSTGAGETMGNTGEMLRGGDGMGIDCAGNLYVTSNAVVTVVDVTVETFDIVDTIEFPSVQGVTNVAFGGPNRTTMYVTSLGNEPKLFSVDLGVVGRPY
jgi:gluconolactonase